MCCIAWSFSKWKLFSKRFWKHREGRRKRALGILSANYSSASRIWRKNEIDKYRCIHKIMQWQKSGFSGDTVCFIHGRSCARHMIDLDDVQGTWVMCTPMHQANEQWNIRYNVVHKCIPVNEVYVAHLRHNVLRKKQQEKGSLWNSWYSHGSFSSTSRIWVKIDHLNLPT